jgi:hypothetical protein
LTRAKSPASTRTQRTVPALPPLASHPVTDPSLPQQDAAAADLLRSRTQQRGRPPTWDRSGHRPRERNWDGKRSRQTRMNALQVRQPTHVRLLVTSDMLSVPTTPPAQSKAATIRRTRTRMLLVRTRNLDRREPDFWIGL